MRKITFLRHAKPSYQSLDEESKDCCIQRALSLTDTQYDCVITSTALRAKLTCFAILEALDDAQKSVIELESLYLALGEVEFINFKESSDYVKVLCFLKEKAPNLMRAFEFIQTTWQTSHNILIIAHSGVMNFLGYLFSQKDFQNIQFNYLEGFILKENDIKFEVDLIK